MCRCCCWARVSAVTRFSNVRHEWTRGISDYCLACFIFERSNFCSCCKGGTSKVVRISSSRVQACKSRRYSADDTKFIKNEICRFLVAEIIEPARSPWRAQVQVVNHGSKKMSVIDYSPTINRFTILDAYPLPSIENLPRGSSRQILQLAGLAVRLLSNTAFARRKALHRF